MVSRKVFWGATWPRLTGMVRPHRWSLLSVCDLSNPLLFYTIFASSTFFYFTLIKFVKTELFEFSLFVLSLWSDFAASSPLRLSPSLISPSLLYRYAHNLNPRLWLVYATGRFYGFATNLLLAAMNAILLTLQLLILKREQEPLSGY